MLCTTVFNTPKEIVKFRAQAIEDKSDCLNVL